MSKRILFICSLITIISFIAGGMATVTALAHSSLAQRLAGRILLQVEEKGEAWYVDPVTFERHYLGRPQDCFDLMRGKGLGITNSDLEQIPAVAQISDTWKTYHDKVAGYEFNYPKEWIEERPEEPGGRGGIKRSLDNDNYCMVAVEIVSNEFGSNESEIIALRNKGYNESTVIIDGISAIRLTKSHPGLWEAVYLSHNEDNVRIHMNRGFGTKLEEECNYAFNQILTSFKFIE